MDDNSSATKSKEKGEASDKFKDGYVQLAEKMEQVRNQMAKMERKYDELYQTVKEKEFGKKTSVSTYQASPEELKSQRESVAEATSIEKSSITQDSPTIVREETKEQKSSEKTEIDIEKMEDNPFL